MSIKKVVTGDKARLGLLDGFKKVAEAVSMTIGPGGRNVCIADTWGTPKVTKDGVTVAKSIVLNNIEGEGSKLIVSASDKTATSAGDGTSNTCLLAYHIAKEGMSEITKGCKSTYLKRGIDWTVQKVVELIKSHSKMIETNQEVEQVATISANGDSEIGKLIAEAVKVVGKDGVITVEEAKGLETELEVAEGFQLKGCGYLSSYFVTDVARQTVEYDNPLIFLYDGKIESVKSILPLLEQVSEMGRPLLMVCDEIDNNVLAMLVVNVLKGSLRVCAVKAPSFGDIRKYTMEDIATLTGGQFVSTQMGIDLDKLNAQAILGSCEKIKVTPTETVIIQGNGDKKEIEQRIEDLKCEIEVVESEYDREKLKERLAYLTGGVAVIRVGGKTEVDMHEKKDLVDDAVCATKSALEEGILVGGGVALLRASKELESIDVTKELRTKDERIGFEIIKNSLSAQIKQIAENIGICGEIVAENVLSNDNYNYGYNAVTQEYCDMVETGIIDSTKVVRNALENGSAVAGSLLTIECVVLDDIEANMKMAEVMKAMQ